MSFNINDYKNFDSVANRYAKQLNRLRENSINPEHIKNTVEKSIQKIKDGISSFVIYGEPQSGKTELMIALTAKLLDEGHKVIVVLLNDNVGLLEQNLKRFSISNITPDPKNFREILDPNINIADHEWIIFCKKNSGDLTKLIEKIENVSGKIIIDDESDYASPNGKVNKNEVTKINKLIIDLLKNEGKYIGVTATPARLDLNNTFKNSNTDWVEFESHDKYCGQEKFFPINDEEKFKITYLPEENDSKEYLKEALFRFLVSVAYLNLNIKEGEVEKKYVMLIHTSGKKLDHDKDYKNILEVIDSIKDEGHKKFEQHISEIYKIAKEIDEHKAHDITKYVVKHKNDSKTLVINSGRDKENLRMATEPSALFTIAIAGNIVGRGVTFNNLLSMYFTRDVKTKMQQDTYIQRARMFGVRTEYLNYFNLTIPKQLYNDWRTCFIYHKLALDSVRSGNSPVWIESKRTRAVASSSVDKNTVEMNSGEMSYKIFKYNQFEEKLKNLEVISNTSSEKLEELYAILGGETFPEHLMNFIRSDNKEFVIHAPADISSRGDDTNKENISRARGLMGASELESKKYPNAIHHIKIFHNSNENARVFYKYTYLLKFLTNPKNG